MCSVVELADSWRKFEHGNELFREVQRVAEAFISSHPYRVDLMPNASAGEFTVWLTVDEAPDDIGLLLGDSLHNLRSALDCMVAAMARRRGGDDSETQFPICDDPSDFTNRYRNRRLRALSTAEIDFLEGIQPYSQGLRAIHPLCYLRDMSNVDKHRLIVPVLVAADRVPVGTFWNMSGLRISHGPFIPKERCVLAHVPFSVAPRADIARIEPDLSLELPGAMHQDLVARMSTIVGTTRAVLLDASKLP